MNAAAIQGETHVAEGLLTGTIGDQAISPVVETQAELAGAGRLGSRELRRAGHTRWIRICHWIMAASVLSLAFSGFFILMAHPRLYWGAVGNDLTPALLELPISRNYRHGGWEPSIPFFADAGSPVSAVRTYDILNENSWGRSLHFLAAWFLVVTTAVYVLSGIFTGHARRDLVPGASELTPRLFWQDLVGHLRLHIQPTAGGPPYGLLQKCAYFGVVFIALPLMIFTGLALSPAIAAAYPILRDVFGETQSLRTIHFFAFVVLILFLVVHVLMVIMSGFKRQLRAMTFWN
jgi:thiosulfate reductase cytochrome b subunit